MIGRREFIALLGGAATWPLAARAQQPALPVVGVLSSTSSSDRADAPLLSQELKAAGYIDGQTVAIEYHWANGEFNKLPAMALDLVRHKVAVIYTSNAPATFAAKAATTTIPIIFAIGGDPVEQGIVASMNRPEANVTGVTFYTSELGPKRLELLRELVPQSTIIAFLTNPNTPVAQRNTADIEAAARSVGRRVIVVSARTAEEIDTALVEISRQGAGALVVEPNALFSSRHDQLVALAAQHKLPAIYYNRDFTAAGGLMTYGDDRAASLRQASVYVGRILKGEKVSNLPVLRPTKFELVINLKTAKTLGLNVPASMQQLADEVIE